MSEEELKKICKEEFLKNIKENIKSGTIFTYVDGLEKENKKQKEVIDKIKEIMNTTPDTNYSYDYVILKNEIYKLLEEIE